MKISLRINAVEFKRGFVFDMGNNLYQEFHEVKTLEELEKLIQSKKSAFKNNNHKIYLNVLNRKIKGFDEWKSNNIKLFENESVQTTEI